MTTLITQTLQSGTIASRLVWLPYGAKSVTIVAIMNAADIATGGNAVSVALIWTKDCVQVSHAASCSWNSGQNRIATFNNVAPGLRMQIPAGITGFAGQLIVPKALDIGLSMDIQDINGNSLPIVAPSGAGVTVNVPVYPAIVT